MKPRTKTEWLDYYAAKTGTTDLNLHPDELVFYHPEHGFVTYLTYDDTLEIHHMCGDGKYWVKFLKAVSKFEGVKKFRMYTERNPKAWMRRYGGEVKGYYMEAEIEEIKD